MPGSRNFSPLAPFAAVALIVLAVTVCFWPVLGSGFSNWDDSRNVVFCPQLASPGLSFIPWSFTNFLVGDFKPLVWYSYALDYRLWELSPLGYHLTNLILHALNTVLVWFFLKKIFPFSGRAGRGAVLLATLFWGLHPLRLESVAWISDRKGLLAAAFSLLAFLTWMSPRRPGRGGWLRKLVFPAAAAGALLSKPVSVVLILLIPLLEWMKPRAERLSPGLLALRLSPLFVASAAVAYVAFYGQARSGSLLPLGVVGLPARAGYALIGLVFYPFKTLLPLKLSGAYPVPPLAGFQLLAAIAFFVLLVGWVLFRRGRGDSRPVFWLLFYLVGILPLAGFFPAGLVTAADRFSYLPAVAFSGLLLSGPRREWFRLICAGVVLIFAVLTLGRALTVWPTPQSYWLAAVAATPDSLAARAHCGQVLFDGGHPGAAIEHLEAADSLARDSGLADSRMRQAVLNNLAQALRMQGRYAEAELRARQLLQLEDHWLFRYVLGSILQARGLPGEALEQYRMVLASNPAWVPALCEAGIILAGRGNLEEAMVSYRRALRADPASPRARYYLALALLDGGRRAEARELLEGLTRRYPASRWLARARLAAEKGFAAARDIVVPPSPDIPFQDGRRTETPLDD